MDDGCGSTDRPGKNEEKNRNVSGKTSATGSEKKLCEKTLKGCDYPTRASQHVVDTSMARAETSTPPTVLPHDFGSIKQANDVISLMGLKAQDEKELMDVSSPLPLPTNASREELEIKIASTGPLLGKKPKAKVQIKKMAREKGKVNGLASET